VELRVAGVGTPLVVPSGAVVDVVSEVPEHATDNTATKAITNHGPILVFMPSPILGFPPTEPQFQTYKIPCVFRYALLYLVAK
jgi:hypothetical protein